MRFTLNGTMTLSWREIVHAAQTAEAAGFDAFYASDHLQAVYGFADEEGVLDAVAVITALATQTSSIRLGCLVSPITMREPIMLARALSAVDVISGGRVDIGLGAGWSTQEHDAFGLPFPGAEARLASLAHGVEIMSALWEEDAARCARLGLAGLLRPRPVQQPAPIVIAGGSAAAIRIAAERAARLVFLGTPLLAADMVTQLRMAESRAGRAPGSVEACVSLPLHLTRDQREIEEMVAATLASVPPPAQRRFGRDIDAARDVALARMFVGSPEALKARVEEYRAAGVERMILSTPRPFRSERVQELGDAVGLIATRGT